MAELSTLEPLVRGYVKDCPLVLIEGALNRAAREFCKRTLAWRETQTVTLLADSNAVAISVLGTQNVIKTVKAKVTGATKYLNAQDDVGFLPVTSGRVLAYAAEKTSELMFGPMPVADTEIDVTLAVMPALAQTTVADDLVTLWGECIADGAIGYLCNEDGYAWFNPRSAESHKQKFNQGITSAINAIEMGLTNSEPLFVTPRF